MAGKSYHCKICQHTFWFVEKTVGNVPDRCPSCGSAAFDGVQAISKWENKRKETRGPIWEGSIIGPGKVREWDP